MKIHHQPCEGNPCRYSHEYICAESGAPFTTDLDTIYTPPGGRMLPSRYWPASSFRTYFELFQGRHPIPITNPNKLEDWEAQIDKLFDFMDTPEEDSADD